eukprot:1391527-Rhodomonas_salina.1
MGTESSRAKATHDTSANTLLFNSTKTKYLASYTVLDLDKYNVVLGMPFINSMKVLIQGGLDGYFSVTSQSRAQYIPTRTEGSKDCKLFHVSLSVMRKDLCQSEEKYELFLTNLAKCGDDLEGASKQIVLQSITQEKDNPDQRYPPTDLISQTSSTK